MTTVARARALAIQLLEQPDGNVRALSAAQIDGHKVWPIEHLRPPKQDCPRRRQRWLAQCTSRAVERGWRRRNRHATGATTRKPRASRGACRSRTHTIKIDVKGSYRNAICQASAWPERDLRISAWPRSETLRLCAGAPASAAAAKPVANVVVVGCRRCMPRPRPRCP